MRDKPRIDIVELTPAEDSEALELESSLKQGDSIALRFRRPTFFARSAVYEHSLILCAKAEGRVVGVAAGARKDVRLHGETISALYGYDLRVHPAYRRFGTAQHLAHSVASRLGPTDCMYSFVAAQNRLALQFTRRSFGATRIVPLLYAIVPVIRRSRPVETASRVDPESLHRDFLRHGGERQLLPAMSLDLLYGHVASLRLPSGSAGCSIWSNESLLAEEVVRLPPLLRAAGILTSPLASRRVVPRIPRPGDMVRSWFLYDLFARTIDDLRGLLGNVTASAQLHGRDFLYVLLQENDPMIRDIRKAGYRYFTLPYVFLARGKKVPEPCERIYIDVRDL